MTPISGPDQNNRARSIDGVTWGPVLAPSSDTENADTRRLSNGASAETGRPTGPRFRRREPTLLSKCRPRTRRGDLLIQGVGINRTQRPFPPMVVIGRRSSPADLVLPCRLDHLPLDSRSTQPRSSWAPCPGGQPCQRCPSCPASLIGSPANPHCQPGFGIVLFRRCDPSGNDDSRWRRA
jgi:hypothetical protein